MTAGAVPARFRVVKCRSGATGGASLMLPVSNSDRSVHLPPPDLCLSLLRASTAGLTHQVNTTDTTGMLQESMGFVHIHRIVLTKKAVDETQREENRADNRCGDFILAGNPKCTCVHLSRSSSWLCSNVERTGCHLGGLSLLL